MNVYHTTRRHAHKLACLFVGLIFSSEGGGSMFPQDIGKLLPDYMAQHRRDAKSWVRPVVPRLEFESGIFKMKIALSCFVTCYLTVLSQVT
jgi:hypothetical protein